jgi:MFS transporter, OFA family, oxalate/formate antiporter
MAVDGRTAAPAGGQKYLVLVAAVAMQLCLGATYSWAVFVGPLRNILGLSQGAAQLPFTVFYFVFPATMVIAGFFLSRIGPRLSAMLGGALFGAGWVVASFGSHHFVFVVLGIGALAGIGVGFAYIVPIAVCIRWFPERQGFVTGIAVAGFGGGAALIGQIAGRSMETDGVTPFTLFRVLGIVFGLIVVVAGAMMRFPGKNPGGGPARWNVRDILRRREFPRLYLAMVAGLAAGFAVNANLKELAPADAVGVGLLSVSLFAVANALGRILWGALFDRLGASMALRLNLVAQAAVLVAGVLLARGPEAFALFAAAAGLNYGGVLVLYASTVGRVFGVERVGQVYGLLFTANIVAAPAPVVCGLVFDRFGSFAPALLVLAVLMLAAARGVIPQQKPESTT